jgi:nucleoside-diphosphate-sugar epimerase
MIENLSSRIVRPVIDRMIVSARFAVDGMIIGLAFYLAYLIRYDGRIPQFQQRQFLLWLVPMIIGRLVTQKPFGLHEHKWRYVGTYDISRVLEAYAAFSLVILGLRLLLPSTGLYDPLRLPIGVIVVEFMISLLGTIAVRGLRRFIHQSAPSERKGETARRILLVGAGLHGITVANEMVLSPGMRVVGFVDDDPNKIGAIIAAVPVLGPVSCLRQLVEKHKVDEVLICIPPAGQKNLKIELPKDLSVRTRIVPTLDEILSAEAAWPSFTEASSRPIPASVRRIAQPILGHRPSSIRDKTILITGGAGFIGSSLAEKLADNNHVILFDLTFRQKPLKFTRLLAHPNVQTLEGNLLHGTDMRSLCQEVDMVVHAAALVGVNRVCSAGRETLETNYVGTSRLLQALEGSKKLQRFIYFSTSEVFGVNSFRVDENSPPSVGPIAEARWSYAIAKLAGEHLAKAYFRETGMPITIVRPFNIFGPKRIGEHALLRFIVNALSGKPVQVHGDGSQIRSWCYIEDFSSALLSMLERPEAVGEDFNIGNASNTLTILELARKVVDLCGTDVPINFVDHPFPDVSIRVPSLIKAQSLLGYKPLYDLDSAIWLTVEWYRENLDFFLEGGSVAAAIPRPQRKALAASAPLN